MYNKMQNPHSADARHARLNVHGGDRRLEVEIEHLRGLLRALAERAPLHPPVVRIVLCVCRAVVSGSEGFARAGTTDRTPTSP
jgi:hypothetical protein